MAAQTQEVEAPVPAVPMSYRQIADDLTARIRAGEYNNADKRLPTYPELAALYSVSYATAARAYATLQDRGVTQGSPGRAVFVVEDEPSDGPAPA